MQLLEALRSLHVDDDSAWTVDGQPKMEVLRDLTGDQNLTREHVVKAAPQFTRADPKVPLGKHDADAPGVDSAPEPEPGAPSIASKPEAPREPASDPVPLSRIEQMEADLQELDLKLHELTKARHELDESLAEISRLRDRKVRHIERARPVNQDAARNLAWRVKQREILAQQHAQVESARRLLGDQGLVDAAARVAPRPRKPPAS